MERAFADAVFRNRISRDIPEAMLEGFEWDVNGRRYDNRTEVIEYCVRVGSTVGAMMTVVMDRRDPPTRWWRRAGSGSRCSSRTLPVTWVRTRGAGRLYLPSDTFREAGISPNEWLASPSPVDAIRGIVRTLLDDANDLYSAAWRPGIEGLPARCRPAIRAAALVYAEIGQKIREADCDSVTQRAWTGRTRKKALLLARSPRSPTTSLVGAGQALGYPNPRA